MKKWWKSKEDEARAKKNLAIDAIEAEGRWIGRVRWYAPDPETGVTMWWMCRQCGVGVLDRPLHERWHDGSVA